MNKNPVFATQAALRLSRKDLYVEINDMGEVHCTGCGRVRDGYLMRDFDTLKIPAQEHANKCTALGFPA